MFETQIRNSSHIRDEMLEEVNFEQIMDQEIDSDEEILSDDAGYTSDLSERDTDYVERFVPSSEIRAPNNRTKHCIIHCYYTTGGALNDYATARMYLPKAEFDSDIQYKNPNEFWVNAKEYAKQYYTVHHPKKRAEIKMEKKMKKKVKRKSHR
ncbi:hypothetical protein G5I_02577 [Acromyrmex echinatior]|uniref:Uncharacterized protein n=1 Tax=Acromyrmex echinatior TaxID=103372 RepID=F4WAN9_ACREC|nr:hypothetical protein G5I_02577 [Acromyrmex echinatior]